ncbi:MAG: aminotransferase class V-fold PLP-dependent enzyme [Chitinophagales bacterium]|nr:aminotransferase class V-fold PLP-dependent enzyme [Chitinophagales bacterium]
MHFDFDEKQRKAIVETVFEKIEHFYSNTKDYSTTPELNIQKIRGFVESPDLTSGNEADKALLHVVNGLEKYTVHTPHPKYFGLFNPRSNFAGIIADFLTASYNPQLAAWSHAPFAVEAEALVVRELATKFGLDKNSADGVFATGGAEANLTAVLCALNKKHPNFARDGLFGLEKKPLIFCSEEAHHSVQKAAKIVGLGYDLVKPIPVDGALKMDTKVLEQEIEKLKNSPYSPLMVIGTAGTTGTGTVDDLTSIFDICRANDIWFHVDAAYGGAAVLSTKLKHLLKGIECSDSITFDAHKWMSVPMGASLFLTAHSEILGKTFRITTEYMPKEASEMEIIDPFAHSIQWSRRFIGLKVYLSLLFYGWNAYEKTINDQVEIGDFLRSRLMENGWTIKNDTRLPLVCFTDRELETDLKFTKTVLANILSKGTSWLSLYPINDIPTFRVCITNYNTAEMEIEELVRELNEERKVYKKNH